MSSLLVLAQGFKYWFKLVLLIFYIILQCQPYIDTCIGVDQYVLPNTSGVEWFLIPCASHIFNTPLIAFLLIMRHGGARKDVVMCLWSCEPKKEKQKELKQQAKENEHKQQTKTKKKLNLQKCEKWEFMKY